MTTRCALYIRVSTDEQHQSAHVQELDARRFAASRGWDVVDVYRDEGVSGAEWTTRPQIARARVDVERLPRPWDVLLVRDIDRVGRDTARTLLFVELLHDAGATVVEYSTGVEAKGDSMARATVALRGIFAEMEREMISARVRGSHESRARRGLVTGGKVFGYRNVRVADGVLHEIDEAEARVVLEIFERAARGEGVRGIARALNERGIASPRVGAGGTGSWSPSVVHDILRRERYVGRVSWGKTRKGYRKGTKVRRPQDAEAVLTTEAPALRIVPDDLWSAVRARSQASRVERGFGSTTGRAPRYLLTGLSRCATCGGPIQVQWAKQGGQSVPVYGCGWHRDRGSTVCPNALRRPVARVDAAVLGWIAEHILSADVVDNVVALVRRSLTATSPAEAKDAAAAVDRAEAQLQTVEREVRNLASALAGGAEGIAAVVSALKEREARAGALRTEIDAAKLRALPRPTWLPALDEIRARATDLQRLLTDGADDARKVLLAIFSGPLTFEPFESGSRDKGYFIRGDTRLDAVLFASPEGHGQNRIAVNVPGPPARIAA